MIYFSLNFGLHWFLVQERFKKVFKKGFFRLLKLNTALGISLSEPVNKALVTFCFYFHFSAKANIFFGEIRDTVQLQSSLIIPNVEKRKDKMDWKGTFNSKINWKMLDKDPAHSKFSSPYLHHFVEKWKLTCKDCCLLNESGYFFTFCCLFCFETKPCWLNSGIDSKMDCKILIAAISGKKNLTLNVSTKCEQ